MNLNSALFGFCTPLLFIAMAIVNIAVAISVHRDAVRLEQRDAAALKILSPLVWTILCLFGGVPALALYWAAHHSTWAK